LSLQPSPHLRGDPPAALAPEGEADRRELAVIAVERTRMPMVVSDASQPDYPIVLANKAFLELTGYSAEEVIGRNCRFLQGPDTSRAAIARIRTAIEEERDVDVELLNYRKDGSTFWNQLGLSPIHDDNGRLLYIFGSQIDITPVRRAQDLEAAEHALLREVDHRANNVLALVQAIVQLSRSTNADHYASAVRERIFALSRAHDILARRAWRDVPLDEVVRAVIEPYASRRLEAQGPEIQIAPLLVQPLALLVHELIENAAVHGALSGSAGSVLINWRTDPDTGQVILDWRERGGPPPAKERPRGFGSVIKQRIVERELRGELHETWAEPGLEAELRFAAH
jgi:PAS domain S-box-containing protein